MSGYQYLSEEGFRVDGRRASEMRKLDCSLGVFTQADGSAYVKQGNTVVLAAVYGPHEVRGGRVKVCIPCFAILLSVRTSTLGSDKIL